jgi:hypothetical protein
MSRLKRTVSILAAGAVVLLAACGDEPTSPRQHTLTVSAEQLAALNAALDDAMTRLVPALADQTASQDVRRALAAGSAGLAARDGTRLDAALGGARTALGRPDAPESDAPIVESLRFVIERVHAAARETHENQP